jgi:hypothetical protein
MGPREVLFPAVETPVLGLAPTLDLEHNPAVLTGS